MVEVSAGSRLLDEFRVQRMATNENAQSTKAQQRICKTCSRDVTRIDFHKRDFNPLLVMQALGRLVVIGQQIQYLQRVRVTNEGIVTTDVAPVVSSPSSLQIAQGQGSFVTMTGNGLAGISAGLEKVFKGVSVSVESTAPDGKSAKVKLVAGVNADTGETNIILTKEATQRWLIPLQVTAATPIAAAATPIEIVKGASLTVKIVNTEFTSGADCESSDSAALECKVDSSNDTDITLKLQAKPSADPGTAYSIRIVRGEKSKPIPIRIKAAV